MQPEQAQRAAGLQYQQLQADFLFKAGDFEGAKQLYMQVLQALDETHGSIYEAE